MPLGPGGLDPNGIWLYGEDDSEALASDLLNLGMDSVSDVIAALPTPADPAILQVVSFNTVTTTTTTSASFVNSAITASITPSSATSKIVVQFSSSIQSTAHSSSAAITQLFRGDVTGTALNLGGSTYSGQNYLMQTPVSGLFLDSPATTASVTYTIGIKSSASGYTSTLSSFQNMILMEVAV